MALRIVFFVAVALIGNTAGSTIATLSRHGASAEEGDVAFQSYLAEYYQPGTLGNDQYAMRKALFEKRLAEVHAHNAKPDRLWTAGISKFSAHTEDELKAMLGYRKGARPSDGGSPSFLERTATYTNYSVELPKEKNWLHLDKAYKVRDQGSCGSCWASTTSSVLEAHYEIYKAKDAADRTFSTQEIVDCTPNPRLCGGKGGCDGATVELGMDYIVKNGLATDDQVPYSATTGTCTANKKQSLAAIGGGASFGLVSYKMLPRNEDMPLAEAVAKLGPVGISAAAKEWFLYSSGIFDGCPKNSVVDHAITLYGYGEEPVTEYNLPGKKYWLIRNSWGKSWGEKGFIRLLRHDSGEKYCGTDNNNQEGTGCKGDPKSVTVCGMCGMQYDSVVPLFKNSPGHASLAEVNPQPGLMRAEPQ